MSSLSQKQIAILLAVIAGLLAAIIGIVVYQQQNPSVPGVDPGAANTPQTSPTGGTDGTTGMPTTSDPVAADFDPATAPKVPEGMTPEQYVTEYYVACENGDYAKAYSMLPTHQQAYYGSAEQFESTLKSYGLGEYTVSPQQENGDEITVVGSQMAQGMAFPYTWTFVKGEDGSWLAKTRAK